MNLTATQIAQLTAIIKGEAGYKRAANKQAAEDRFRAALAAKIGDLAADARAENILGAASFDEAADFLRIALAKSDAQKADEIDAPELTDDQMDAWAAKQSAEKPKARRAALKVIEPAKAAEKPKRERKPEADKPLGKRAAILAAAEAGEIPAAPDFSAETHKRFRGKLAEVIALAEAGDIKGLKAFAINPVSSSPKAIAKYRDLAVIALEARKAKGQAA